MPYQQKIHKKKANLSTPQIFPQQRVAQKQIFKSKTNVGEQQTLKFSKFSSPAILLGLYDTCVNLPILLGVRDNLYLDGVYISLGTAINFPLQCLRACLKAGYAAGGQAWAWTGPHPIHYAHNILWLE